MSDLQVLTDMGFSQERAGRALEVTNNKGVEPAMEWLLAHADEDISMETSPSAPAAATAAVATTAEAIPSSTSVQPNSTESTKADENSAAGVAPTTSTTTTEEATAAEVEAKSFKCNDCNRLFSTQLEIEFHAAKTGHNDFAESTEEKKPLTDVEKKEQMSKLEEKLKQKRFEREEQEKRDALDRERLRIKSGKDMSEARRKMEEVEMAKLVQQRKREKEDERMARERVRAQIEADKQARKLKMAGGQTNNVAQQSAAASPTSPISAVAAAVASPQSPSSSTTSTSKAATVNYTKTKIQVRLPDGSTLTDTFDAKESLSAVRLFVQLKRNDPNGEPAPFSLMTTFPRRVFTDDDYDKPLSVLGLVPSAVVIVTKK